MTDAEKRKIVERELYRYKENKAIALSAAHENAYRMLPSFGGTRSSRTNRNGMEDAIIRAADEADRAARWCKVFRLTCKRYRSDDLHMKYMRLTFEKKFSCTEICKALGTSRVAYRFWKDDAIANACRVAAALHLIEPLKNPYPD